MLRRSSRNRRRLTDPDAAVRRSAVESLDPESAAALADTLARLLREDPDAGVRRACLSRVADRTLLQSLLDDPQLGKASAQRLLALAGDGQRDAGAAGALPDHPNLLIGRLEALPGAEAAGELARLQDVDELVELALAARGALRDAVLDHPLLHLGAGLGLLEKRSRHKDKSLNRHARRLLDQRKEAMQEAASVAQRAAELAAALERRAPPGDERAWIERQHELHRRLDEALDRHAALRHGLSTFGDRLDDLERLRADPAALPPIVVAATDPEPPRTEAPADVSVDLSTRGGQAAQPGPLVDPFEALVAAFHQLGESLAGGGEFAQLSVQRQQLTDQWLSAADHLPPSAAQHAVFEAVSHRYRELADAMQRLEERAPPEWPSAPLVVDPEGAGADRRSTWQAVERHRALLQRLQRARRDLRWPAWAAATAELVRLDAAIATLEHEVQDADRVLTREVDSLDGELKALNAAIDEGHLSSAQNLLNDTRTHLDALPAAATRQLGRRVGKQAARLAELKDWQTFATTPKRQELVHAMESLVSAPLPPAQQAERIKHLRRDWQALGPVTQAADGRLADRFNAQAERAFEPCRSYFGELAAQRQANLAERRRICDQLERYLAETDWDHADMKAAERIMRTARDEWRRHHPVDRQPGKAVEARFESLQNTLHHRVKAEWDRNLTAKRAVVAEAEALLDSDLPTPDKVATVKALQGRWRDIGITPRRPDQQLWHAFRGACDRIFAARDEARNAAHQASDETVARITALLDAFAERLATLSAADVRDTDGRELRQQTAEIDRLPTPRRKALERRRHDLLARHAELLGERRRDETAARLLAIRAWDEACDGAEPAGTGAAATTLPQDVIEARRAAAGGVVPHAALRRLAIKVELMAGFDSPADDASLRLEVQVERLQAGLGRGAETDSAGALLDAWCRLGPKDDSAGALRERFFAAITALQGRGF